MKIIIPIRTYSEANIHEHWAKRGRRVKHQRQTARLTVGAHLAATEYQCGNLTIQITRIAPRKLDTDNLARSGKAVQDGIADALRIDDGDERLTWLYAQRKGKPKEYLVEVEISEGTE